MGSALSQDGDDSDLRAFSADCRRQLKIARGLKDAVLFGFSEWLGLRDRPQEFLASIRNDFAVFLPNAKAMDRWHMELDAASSSIAWITPERTEPNWHVAVCVSYALMLSDVWRSLLTPKELQEINKLRIVGDVAGCLERLGPLPVERLAAKELDIRERFQDHYTLDFRAAFSEIARELARALHNRAMRPGRPLRAKDSPLQMAARDLEDDEEKDSPSLPDNTDVLDLCRLLNKAQDRVEAGTISLIGIAREFTNEKPGSEPRAQNLMRQARRFSHLWKRADR